MIRATSTVAAALLWALACGSSGQPSTVASGGAPGLGGSGGSGAPEEGGATTQRAGAPSRGGSSSNATGGSKSQGGAVSRGGQLNQAGANSAGANDGALGEYPVEPSPVTRGGTMTFTNVGAAGWWPRRINRSAGDPGCDYKDGKDTWGGQCCMTKHETASTQLSPFDEEMTLILKAIQVKQLAVYQPANKDAPYVRISSWDRRAGSATDNLWFTQKGDGSAQFTGDLSKNDCVGYVMQSPKFECGDGRDYYCPNDAGVLHRGFSGSKLVVFLGSMSFDDAEVKGCDGQAQGHPGPWVAFVASELIRDGGRKWNGACNCYSKTGSVGDGCGEINVFEVVMDNNEYSNREFASTGVRAFQAGHVGGAVCTASCSREQFDADADVVDACAKKAYDRGPVIETGGKTDGCPVWRRPAGDRYFFILLDQKERVIQVGMVHPAAIPDTLSPLLPRLPSQLERAAIDAMVTLRLPN